MAGLIEAMGFGFIVLTVLYVLVATYARSVERERLERAFDAGGVAGGRDDFIARGLSDYEHGLRRRLIGLVYVVPLVVIGVTAYLVNAQ